MSEADETGLVLAGVTMPTARSVASILKEQLDTAVLAERARRGDVHSPEDTFGMHRSLARVVEVTKDYEYAFRAARREAEAIAEEELIEAVGEQDGHPNQPLTVPDPEGDVRISPSVVNSYQIDQDALHSAVAFSMLAGSDSSGELIDLVEKALYHGEDRVDDFLAQLITEALNVLCTLGKFEPQVSKVRVFAKELAREPGGDGVSATVTSAIKKTTDYRGVKIERKVAK